MKKVALIFHRVGPYHFARARAAGRVLNTTLIEIFKSDDTYGWDIVLGAEGFSRVTLFEKNLESVHKITGAIHSALNNCRPDAVAIPGWGDAVAFSSLQWCAANRIPAIVMSETTEWDESRRAVKEWVKGRILKICAAGLVGGRPHADYLARLGMPSDRIFQGYDAVDNDYFAHHAAEARDREMEVRKKFELPRDFFLASARFVGKKNLLNLIRAYALYRKQVEKAKAPWPLVLLGDGPLKSELSNLIAGLQLEKFVLLPGFKQYHDLPAFYGLANVFIHASTVEQWGLVVNEAMASGLPVLVSNRCGCARDLVQDGVNGYTFDPPNVGQMAELMFRVSGSGFPLSKFGAASSNIIADWGPERFGRGLHLAVETVLSSPCHQPALLGNLLLPLLLRKKTS